MDDQNHIPPDDANADATTPTSDQTTPDAAAAQVSEEEEAATAGSEPSSASSSATEPIADAWTPVPEASAMASGASENAADETPVATSEATPNDSADDTPASTADAGSDETPEPVVEASAAPDDTPSTISSAENAESDEGATTASADDYEIPTIPVYNPPTASASPIVESTDAMPASDQPAETEGVSDAPTPIEVYAAPTFPPYESAAVATFAAATAADTATDADDGAPENSVPDAAATDADSSSPDDAPDALSAESAAAVNIRPKRPRWSTCWSKMARCEPKTRPRCRLLLSAHHMMIELCCRPVVGPPVAESPAFIFAAWTAAPALVPPKTTPRV